MANSKADLVIHPVRLRLTQALAREPMTTAELAESLGDVPTSSIYRHLKRLRDQGFVYVVDVRNAGGAKERVYGMARSGHLSQEDLGELSPDKHRQLFITYLMTLLRDFSAYVGKGSLPDFARDRAGYNEVTFYASDAEFDAMAIALNKAIEPLLHQRGGRGRKLRKLATITFPMGGGPGVRNRRAAAKERKK